MPFTEIENAIAAVADAWRAAGAKVETVATSPAGAGVDLRAVFELLGREGVLQAMVEGGATVHGALLGAGLVDRIVAYVGATALGPAGRAVFDAPGPATIAGAPRFALKGVTRFDDDVRLDYDLRSAQERL